MIESGDLYLIMAQASLAGAHSEFEQHRFDNAANRAYFACFQAAVAALLREGPWPEGGVAWEHTFVQSRFVGILINRRKRYSTDLRDTLMTTMRLRHKADYDFDSVTADQAARALRRATRFVEEIQRRGRA